MFFLVSAHQVWCAANFDTAAKCAKVSGIEPPPGSTREGPRPGSTEHKLKTEAGADSVGEGPMKEHEFARPEHELSGTKWDPTGHSNEVDAADAAKVDAASADHPSGVVADVNENASPVGGKQEASFLEGSVEESTTPPTTPGGTTAAGPETTTTTAAGPETTTEVKAKRETCEAKTSKCCEYVNLQESVDKYLDYEEDMKLDDPAAGQGYPGKWFARLFVEKNMVAIRTDDTFLYAYA